MITTINTHEPTIESAIRALETYGLDEEAWEQLLDDEEPHVAIRKTTTASELAQKAMDHTKKTFEQMVPTQYHRHRKVFSEEASHRFPPKRPWDHAIDLLPDAPKTLDCKVYPLAITEGDALTEFLNEQLEKGYIRPSKSPYASPFFFIKKKDGKLRPVQDYRKLNALTIKNRYPLPLIPEIIDKVRDARLFTKLDVRWGYNNVRIKEGDESKAAFKTNQGLYEPRVMFFGLTNSPSTFQTMMDTIFRDLILTNEVIMYMDDILIATVNDLSHHREITHQVLYRLEEHDLYLKPEKCSFETPEVEYLGVIIGYGKIRMDPIKTQGVQMWEAPKNLTETRGFVGFLNFYRRFIKGFSKLARPLHDLTKKGVQWRWTQTEQTAFEALKEAVSKDPVLLFPNLTEPFEMEVDASAIAIGAVLNQKGQDGKTHPVAYYSESFSTPERNYDVYDRELLAIVKALRQWRTYLLGSPHQITIYTDHSNLQYWKEPRKINRRVAREFQELSEYDFTLRHIPGTTNTRADALSRQSTGKEAKEDNNDVIVLPDEIFTKTTYTSLNHVDIQCREEQIRLKNELQPWINHHNLRQHDQLWWKNDALVVVGNNDLRRGVIQSFHDPPVMGHPGIANTYALTRRDYWWPNMKKDIEEYVKGCALCQANKINTHTRNPTWCQ